MGTKSVEAPARKGRMGRNLPIYALIAGQTYLFVRTVRPVEGTERKRIVICRPRDARGNDPDADERYLAEPEWLQAAERFDADAHSSGTVTSQSPAREIIALYRSLFQGRDDVYAHGHLRKDGGIGYAPACANEWERGVCPRTMGQKPRCATCDRRAFAPLTDTALVAHFRGESKRLQDVIGLYVLDDESRTHLLVLDFDKEGWKEAVNAVRRAARPHGIEACVERSRSGNGGHAWFFFEEAIDARLAREFGSALIAEAMALEKSLGFDAFDRMFPAQDTIPEGGFGNLIAAPFQGRAQRMGNSVFVDEAFVPYPDQWLFLSGVKKLSEHTLRAVVDSSRGPGLDTSSDAKKSAGTPWEPVLPKALSQADFPNRLVVVEADMLYIPERDLSARAALQVRRLAAFANPEFFKLQALHRSVYKTPRVIDLSEKRDGYLALPRGCKPKLLAMLNESQVNHTVQDERLNGRHLQMSFTGQLGPEQEAAVRELVCHENGILSAPTGFGKTVIAASLIAQRDTPTLVIVPKTALVAQWAERLEEFLVIEHPSGPALTPSGRPSRRKQHVIGQIGGGKNRVTGIVDIATFQSLTSKDSASREPRAKDLVKNYGLVICDECHHAAAPQLELVLKAVRAKYVYGLSATPRRADGLDRALFMLCGPIRCRIDPRDQAKQQGFRRILKPRFTGIRLADYKPGQTFNQVLDELCEHEARNRLITGDVVEAVQDGRRALVLTKRKEHARRLGALIGEASGNKHVQVHVLVGEGGARQRREKLGRAVDAVTEGPAVIVATESYLGEGFDASALDALFLATPISWDGNVTQQAGRLHRCREGKDHVEIYDYVDTTVPMLERMHKKRLKTYARLGYEVETRDEDAAVPRRAMFIQRDDAMRQLALDITNATASIRIVAPYVSPKAVLMLIEPLTDAVQRGVDVACAVTKAPADEVRARFAAARIPLTTEKAAEHPGLAVFDKKIVWYGTVPLLAFPKADDCSLRLESAEAAHELLDTAVE